MSNVNLKLGKQDLDAYENQFNQAKDAMKPVFDALSGAEKTAALNRLVNWDKNTATANENALYVAVALLYIVVFYLINAVRRQVR